jgi:MerR family transcriptional regulator, copper efflux regulator
VTHVPIACALSADDASARGEEWRQFVASSVLDIERRGPSARLRLRDGDAALLLAADLARREKACCAFFEFRLALLPEGIWLEVDAPAEAAPILDELLRTA